MIINNCELWHPRLDKPNPRFNKKNPTYELQIRTSDKAVKDEWKKLGLLVKLIETDDDKIYYRVNLRKRSVKQDGTKAGDIEVVNGEREPIDPRTIGNGSIGNVRIFQYPYPGEDGKPSGVASVLMGVQVTTHKLFTPKAKEPGFEDTETIIIPEEKKEEQEEDVGKY